MNASFALLVVLVFVGCSTTPKTPIPPFKWELDSFTFIGVPKDLSEGTFDDVDKVEEKRLVVEVLNVTEGNYAGREAAFLVRMGQHPPLNQPDQASPLKPGVKYLITTGFGMYGLMILDYKEVK